MRFGGMKFHFPVLQTDSRGIFDWSYFERYTIKLKCITQHNGFDDKNSLSIYFLDQILKN
jgi:hypothetical protein